LLHTEPGWCLASSTARLGGKAASLEQSENFHRWLLDMVKVKR
jgi:hypothetical protein